MKKENQDVIFTITPKKIKNSDLVVKIEPCVSANTLMAIKACGDFWMLAANFDLTKKKFYSTNSCNNRFCSICAYRKARKEAMKISACMNYIENEHNKDFIFGTFTAPNVKADKLKEEIDHYNLAWKNLMKRNELLPVNKGYIRKLEITYDNDPIITLDMWNGNPKKHMKPRFEYYQSLGLKVGDPNPNYDTYHPHFHVIMAVNKSYFVSRDYINHEQWLELWRDVMGDPNITQVRVQKVKKDDAGKEVSEIAKYAAKDEEMLVSQEVFEVFYHALKGRQVLTYNGLFKDANKLHKLFLKKKPELQVKDPFYKYSYVDETEYVYYLLYRWGFGEYVLEEKRELTPEERKKVNRVLIDEMNID